MRCVKCLVFFLIASVLSLTQKAHPCPKVLTIDISDGLLLKNYSILMNGTVFDSKNYFIDETGSKRACICNIKPCFRKCCGPNEQLIERKCVETKQKLQVQVYEGKQKSSFSDNYHYIYDKECKQGATVLIPHLVAEEEFYLQKNGSLFLPHYKTKPMREVQDFCIDRFDLKDLNMKDMISGLVCILENDTVGEEIELFKYIGMIISIPFLLATFLAYALLPDRNLHMKALMFYVINLMSSYIILVVIQLTNSRFEDTLCKLMGYFCLFFFLVSFFWMNVICIDIWFAFSGLRGFSGSKQSSERKRFLMYCVYACGVPVLHILIVYGIDAWANDSAWYHPGIGVQQCFLKPGYPELMYFHGPMAILITMNIVLFAVTAIKIRSIKKDTSVLKKEDSKRHSYENDKQTFNLYLKLLFAMGVNWSMEIISWAVSWAGKAPDAIWYLTDFCNAIYGVFIFFIFVFKKNIWKLLKKRYYALRGRSHFAHTMTVSHTARTTSYSTANTSISEHPHAVTDTTNLTSEA